MPVSQYEASALENYLNPLLDAANTSSWKHALSILMINGTVLIADENFKTPCLISQTGLLDKVPKAMELLGAKGKANIMPLVTDAIKSFLPDMLIGLQQIDSTKSEDREPSQEEITKTVITVFAPKIEKVSNVLTGMVVEGAFKVSDLAAVWLVDKLGQFRKNQIVSGISEQNYELMIDDLRRLDFIEPKLQVSLCPECLNYELTLSKYPSTRKICPRCGNDVVVMTLFLFKEGFGKLKSKNQDLPLFISAYLKQKLSFFSFLGEPMGIYPLEQINLQDVQNSKVEVDVRVPKLNIGIECKLSEIPVAPMTQQRANSTAANLLDQMRNYLKVGVKDIVIVTNLPKENLEKMNNALKIQLGNSPLPMTYALVSGDIDELICYLNSLADCMAKNMSEEFSRSFKKPVVETQDIKKVTDKEAGA